MVNDTLYTEIQILEALTKARIEVEMIASRAATEFLENGGDEQTADNLKRVTNSTTRALSDAFEDELRKANK